MFDAGGGGAWSRWRRHLRFFSLFFRSLSLSHSLSVIQSSNHRRCRSAPSYILRRPGGHLPLQGHHTFTCPCRRAESYPRPRQPPFVRDEIRRVYTKKKKNRRKKNAINKPFYRQSARRLRDLPRARVYIFHTYTYVLLCTYKT